MIIQTKLKDFHFKYLFFAAEHKHILFAPTEGSGVKISQPVVSMWSRKNVKYQSRGKDIGQERLGLKYTTTSRSNKE